MHLKVPLGDRERKKVDSYMRRNDPIFFLFKRALLVQIIETARNFSIYVSIIISILMIYKRPINDRVSKSFIV